MNTILNRNRLVQPVARIMRQLLSGFALPMALRENLHVAKPDVAHDSSPAALGLRAAVKYPRDPAHPEWLPTNRPRQKSTLFPAAPQGAVWRQVSGLRNKERAREHNPLTSANSPRSAPRPARPAALLDENQNGFAAGLLADRNDHVLGPGSRLGGKLRVHLKPADERRGQDRRNA